MRGNVDPLFPLPPPLSPLFLIFSKRQIKVMAPELTGLKSLRAAETVRPKTFFVLQSLKAVLPGVIVQGIPSVNRAVINVQEPDALAPPVAGSIPQERCVWFQPRLLIAGFFFLCMCVCMCVNECVCFVKLHIAAQSDPVILAIPCY